MLSSNYALKYPLLTREWFLTVDDPGLRTKWDMHWAGEGLPAQERRIRVIEGKLRAYHTAMTAVCDMGPSFLNEHKVLCELVAQKKAKVEARGELQV